MISEDHILFRMLWMHSHFYIQNITCSYSIQHTSQNAVMLAGLTPHPVHCWVILPSLVAVLCMFLFLAITLLSPLLLLYVVFFFSFFFQMKENGWAWRNRKCVTANSHHISQSLPSACTVVRKKQKESLSNSRHSLHCILHPPCTQSLWLYMWRSH